MIVFDMGSQLYQNFGAEYSSLNSATGCESLAEKAIGSCIEPIVKTSSYIAVMRDAKL